MPHASAISKDNGIALSWVLCGALFFSALVFTPGVFHFYDVTPKVAILLLSCAACLTLRKTWLPGFSLLPHNPMGRAFLALLGLQTVSVVLSTVFSFEPLLSLTGTNWRRLGLAPELALICFALVAACFVAGDKRRVLILTRAIALTGFAGALYGISQYFGFDPLLDPASYHVGEGYWTIVRIPGTLGHAGYFATFLLHGVFAGGALWAAEQRRLWRVFGISTAAIASAAIILSGTRSAILGLAAGVVLLWAWRRPVPRTREWLVLAAIAVSAVAFYFTPPGQKLRARTRWYVEDSQGGARLWLYGDSLAMGADHWLAGTGLETFSSHYPKYQSVEVAQAFPNTYYESPHNILLDAWTSQGLPGVLALGGLIAVAGLAAWRVRGHDSPLTGYLLAGLFAALCSNQFLAFVAVTKLYFFVQISLLAGLAVVTADSRHDHRPSRWMGVVVFTLGLMFAGFALQLAWADRLLQQVETSARSGRIAEAAQQYHHFLAVKPSGMNVDVWFSRLMLNTAAEIPAPAKRLQIWAVAKQAAERAVRHAEIRHSALYNLAFFLAPEEDVVEIEKNLRAAIEWAPHWYKPYWMLAQVLDAAGRGGEARQLAERALFLNGDRNEEVRATWERLAAATASGDTGRAVPDGPN